MGAPLAVVLAATAPLIAETINGDDNDDPSLNGTPEDDTINGMGGNDVIHAGPDNCFIMTGPGRDTVHFAAESLNGTDHANPDGGKTRITDFASGDTIVLEGVQANDVTFEERTMPDDRGGR